MVMTGRLVFTENRDRTDEIGLIELLFELRIGECDILDVWLGYDKARQDG